MVDQFISSIHLICTVYNGSVTSWVRSEARNLKIGGVPDSLHLSGLAVDVVFDNATYRSRALELATRLGIGYIMEKDHIHFQALPLK